MQTLSLTLVLFHLPASTSIKAVDISYDKVSERVTLSFEKEIAPGEVQLDIRFSGIINDAMAGFSRAKYKAAVPPPASTPKTDDFHYMLSTQFESCDARRAFPCFDEPNLKATFDFEIEIPKELVALSNMPVKSERDGSKEGLKIVSFERTPIMSTYVSVGHLSRCALWLTCSACSSWLGLLVILNMSRQRRRASITEPVFPSACILRRVSKNRLGLPWSALTRLSTISRTFSELSTLFQKPTFSPYTSL